MRFQILTVLIISAAAPGQLLSVPFANCSAVCPSGACRSAADIASGLQSPTSDLILTAESQKALASNQWRLIRTPGPDKSETTSIIHIADSMRSDPDFAGITIRCRQNTSFQIAFVLIRPFPPRTHPKVTLGLNGAKMTFDGEVISPGMMVALPDQAEAYVAQKSANELSVDIRGDAQIHGVVPLDDLPTALAQLQSNCPFARSTP